MKILSIFHFYSIFNSIVSHFTILYQFHSFICNFIILYARAPNSSNLHLKLPPIALVI